MNKCKFLLAIALAVFSVSPSARATYSYSASINQIAATGMTAPGTGGTFTSFSAPTTNRDVDDEIDLNPFFFIATTSNGNSDGSGVYAYDTVSGTFTDLADTTMPALTGGGNYASFSNLSSGEGALGFIAKDSKGNQGVYAEGYNALILIATPASSTQAGSALGPIDAISLTGDPYGNPSGMIQSCTGDYIFIVGFPPPELGNLNADGSLSSLGPVSYKGSIGNSIIPGIYDQAFALLADKNGTRSVFYVGPTAGDGFLSIASVAGPIPSGSGTFTSFGNPYVTANEVAFTAHYTTTGTNDQQGVFVYGGYISGGDPTYPPVSLQQIAASGQVAPNSHGATFTGFSDISDTSYDTTFLACLSDGNEGLYININENPPYIPEQIIKVIETGDTLDGQIVQCISLAPDASNFYDLTNPDYANTGIGFEVTFTDHSEGLYYFTINLPEPGCAALLGAAMLFIPRRRR